MKFFLENGLNYQIVLNEQNRFQLWAAAKDKGAWVKIGNEHCRFLDVFDELAACELSLEEKENLSAIKDSVINLAGKVEEWFRLHDEYVATIN